MTETQRTEFAQIRMDTMQVVPGMTAGCNLGQLNLRVKEQEPRQFSSRIARSADNSNTQTLHLIASSCTPLST